MIEQAAAFAAKAHEGAFRKGTCIPYITHPLETAVIVAGFTLDEEMIAAALLHDVVEDAGVTREELEAQFGTRVADLVMALADKLSNMRCTARDYLMLGERLWERFNEKDKNKHAWYYWGIARGCRELEEHVYYKEYIMLCQSVFGSDREHALGEVSEYSVSAAENQKD